MAGYIVLPRALDLAAAANKRKKEAEAAAVLHSKLEHFRAATGKCTGRRLSEVVEQFPEDFYCLRIGAMDLKTIERDVMYLGYEDWYPRFERWMSIMLQNARVYYHEGSDERNDVIELLGQFREFAEAEELPENEVASHKSRVSFKAVLSARACV